MDFIQILTLSIIQGVTEFLPISSQSHLILTSTFLGMKDQGLNFDIALHTGSLIAILIYYRKEINKMLSMSDEGSQYLKLIILGSIPLPIIGLLFIDLVFIFYCESHRIKEDHRFAYTCKRKPSLTAQLYKLMVQILIRHVIHHKMVV